MNKELDSIQNDSMSDIDAAYKMGKAAVQVVIPAEGQRDVQAGVIIPEGHKLAAFPTKKEPAPQFLVASPLFFDAASFYAYVNGFKDRGTIILKDTVAHKFTAALDYHVSGNKFSIDVENEVSSTIDAHTARHCDHIARFEARLTDEWKEWTGSNDKPMDQVEFAEFIEDHQADFISPSPADMLMIATNLEAKTGVDFKQSALLDNGQTQFRYEETISGSVSNSTLEIPKEIILAIAPFEGSDRFKVKAVFRYRISGGGLKLRYKLIGHKDALNHVFKQIAAEIETATGFATLNGTVRT